MNAELRDTAGDFIHSLANDDTIDAANISANRTPYGMEVTARVPEEDREAARELAHSHGFVEAGTFNPDEEKLTRHSTYPLIRYELLSGFQRED